MTGAPPRRSHPGTIRLVALSCLLLGALVSRTGNAQDAVRPGERLSDWLLRQPEGNQFLPALQWQVPAERASQGQLRHAVVQALGALRGPGLDAAARDRLVDRLLALPLTGRVLLALPDARWLQATPEQDPVLQESHLVVLPPRPVTVTVLAEDGTPCAVLHRPGAWIRDYLSTCLGEASPSVDDAWLVQPDGRSTRHGVASWNASLQDEPGIGAWIWAPKRQSRLPKSLSDNLARFLATQLPGEQLWPEMQASARALTASVGSAPRRAPRGAELTASDWGEIGLLQMPSARMSAAGELRFHASRVEPYTRQTTVFQVTDWLEVGYRYSDISNVPYDTFPGKVFQDKSIDFKLRLWQESALWPQVSLGIRDIAGTGLFSGEYLVASKRWGDFDWTVGLGWGYLGTRDNVTNPLSIFGKKFNTRPATDFGQGGTLNPGSYFHGPTALFGGLQWHAPDSRWILKAELDGNNYRSEPFANTQTVKSPLNLGAVYRYSPNVDISLGLERGNRWMLGLTLHADANKLNVPKLLDPPLPKVQLAAPAFAPADGWGSSAADIERLTGWSVRALDHQPGVTSLYAESNSALYLRERVERAVTVLHRDAPASSQRFVLHLQERGLPMTRIDVDRREWLAQRLVAQAPSLSLPEIQTSAGQEQAGAPLRGPAEPYSLWTGKPPGLTAELGLNFGSVYVGPNSFSVGRLGVAKIDYRFTDSTWFSSRMDLRLFTPFSQPVGAPPGTRPLPPVRSLMREYETATLTVPVAQLTHVRQVGNGQFVSAYAGMLESMFGGVGAEWLSRPWQSPLAFGVDINYVRQRDFEQKLGFRDYSVATGHASLYWDTGWNDFHVKLSAGRYLAGDKGATLDVKRAFKSGVTVGAYATKTNVSAEQFGEGSFDKGVYLSFPFDAILPISSSGTGTITWIPVVGDGGAMLRRAFPLFELTKQRDRRALEWGVAPRAGPRTGENNSYILSEPKPNPIETFGGNTAQLGQQLAEVPTSTWLWAGGAILASSLLDKSADSWAQRQAGGSSSLGTLSDAIPWALAIGAGISFTGVAGEGAQGTGELALQAAALSWVGNQAVRYVVGRARPYENLGPTEFNGFRKEALESGFASNHTAVAFALATPFAQRHNMPWLYGLAAVTALGRVQKREHWFSDTVAGALMGYTVGSLLVNQRAGRDAMRLSLTPDSITAHWSF